MPATPAIIPRTQPLLGPTDIGTNSEILSSDGAGGTHWVTASSVGVTDHGALTGLGDDDHPQYPLSAGRAGGQTIVGSPQAGEHLTLRAHSTWTSGEVRIGYAGGAYYTLAVQANQARFNHTVVGLNALIDTSLTNSPKVHLHSAGEFGWAAGTPNAFNADTTIRRDAAGVVRVSNAVMANEIRLVAKTDANRPAAGIAGRVIYNSDDGNLNIDTGTQWVLPDGTIT